MEIYLHLHSKGSVLQRYADLFCPEVLNCYKEIWQKLSALLSKELEYFRWNPSGQYCDMCNAGIEKTY